MGNDPRQTLDYDGHPIDKGPPSFFLPFASGWILGIVLSVAVIIRFGDFGSLIWAIGFIAIIAGAAMGLLISFFMPIASAGGLVAFSIAILIAPLVVFGILVKVLFSIVC